MSVPRSMLSRLPRRDLCRAGCCSSRARCYLGCLPSRWQRSCCARFTSDFLANALSRQAFQALSLSLVTSSITTLIAIALGTPLAFMLARSPRSPACLG